VKTARAAFVGFAGIAALVASVALGAFVVSPALLASFAPLGAQSAASPKLVVPDAPDATITTRRTMDRPGGSVLTEVLYLKGARQRREFLFEHPSQPVVGMQIPRGFTQAQISQCDQQRMLWLNLDAKTYAYEPIIDPATTIARLRTATGRQALSDEKPSRPTFRITLDAVDTGERRQYGRYVARHVITTKTIEPEPGANVDASVDRQDGWYIDVLESNCTTSEGVAFVSGAVQKSGTPPPAVEFKRRGDTRRGYPIEETHRHGGRYAFVSRIELVEFSETPLDQELFTVPDGYRAALPLPNGGYDLTKPDTILNRVDSYRQVVAAWTDYIRRYGLQGILPGTRAPARY
jgi:hypothetical protein